VRRGLVLVPEGRQVLVSLTVHENLLMGAYCRDDMGVAGDIAAIYDRFPNLAARRDMAAGVLSGGEQQMLAISRALLARPRLMMLDEPSLGLSPLLVDRLFAHGAGGSDARLCHGTRPRSARGARGDAGRRRRAGRSLSRHGLEPGRNPQGDTA
jgi:hypothetical protein